MMKDRILVSMLLIASAVSEKEMTQPECCKDCPNSHGLRINLDEENWEEEAEWQCEKCGVKEFFAEGSLVNISCTACGDTNVSDHRAWKFERPRSERIWVSEEYYHVIGKISEEEAGSYTCSTNHHDAAKQIGVCKKLPDMEVECQSFLMEQTGWEHLGVQCLFSPRNPQEWRDRGGDFRACRYEIKKVVLHYRMHSYNIGLAVPHCFLNCTTNFACVGAHAASNLICPTRLSSNIVRRPFYVSATLKSKVGERQIETKPFQIKNIYYPKQSPIMGARGPRSATFRWTIPKAQFYAKTCTHAASAYELHGKLTDETQVDSLRHWDISEVSSITGKTSAGGRCEAVMSIQGLKPHNFYTIKFQYKLRDSRFWSQAHTYSYMTTGSSPSDVHLQFVPGAIFQSARSAKYPCQEENSTCRVFWKDIPRTDHYGAEFEMSAHVRSRPFEIEEGKSYVEVPCCKGGDLHLSCRNEFGNCPHGARVNPFHSVESERIAFAIAKPKTDPSGALNQMELIWSEDYPEEHGPRGKVAILWCKAPSWDACGKGIQWMTVPRKSRNHTISIGAEDAVCEKVFAVAACREVDQSCSVATPALIVKNAKNATSLRVKNLNYVPSNGSHNGAKMILKWEAPHYLQWPGIVSSYIIRITNHGGFDGPLVKDVAHWRRFIGRDRVLEYPLDSGIEEPIPNEMMDGVEKAQLCVKAVFSPFEEKSGATCYNFIAPTKDSSGKIAALIAVPIIAAVSLAAVVFACLWYNSYSLRRSLKEKYYLGAVPRLNGNDLEYSLKDGERISLGNGRYGRVYLGTLTLENKKIQVAIKAVNVKVGQRLSPEEMGQYEHVNHVFMVEAMTLGHLSSGRSATNFSENVVRFYGISMCLNNCEEYRMAMEYANGGNLQKYLEDNANMLQFEIIIKIALGMAQAGCHIERLKYIHRDIKLDNYLVVLDGAGNFAKVMQADFGLARDRGDASPSEMSESSGEVGSNEFNQFFYMKYAPPEAFQLKFKEKSDVYSFGLALWAHFTYGQDPLSQLRTEADTIRRGKELAALLSSGNCSQFKVIPDAPRKPRNVPPQLYELMLQCWRLHSQFRPTFEEARAQIERIAQAERGRNLRVYTFHGPSDLQEYRGTSAEGQLSNRVNGYNNCHYVSEPYRNPVEENHPLLPIASTYPAISNVPRASTDGNADEETSFSERLSDTDLSSPEDSFDQEDLTEESFPQVNIPPSVGANPNVAFVNGYHANVQPTGYTAPNLRDM